MHVQPFKGFRASAFEWTPVWWSHISYCTIYLYICLAYPFGQQSSEIINFALGRLFEQTYNFVEYASF